MKRIAAFLSVMAVALTSCSKDATTDLPIAPEQPGDLTLTITAATEEDGSRTAFADSDYTVAWGANDKIIVHNLFDTNAAGTTQNGGAVTSGNASIDSDTGAAQFTVTFPAGKYSTTYNNKLFFLYPSLGQSSADLQHTSANTIQNFCIPAVQHPTLKSFDGRCDVLYGEPKGMTLSSDTPAAQTVTFGRKAGFVKLRLAGLEEYDHLYSKAITSVTLEATVAKDADDKEGRPTDMLAGDKLLVEFNPESEELAEIYTIYYNDGSEQTNTLTLDYLDTNHEVYTESTLPNITVADILASNTDEQKGLWFSMLPNTLTKLTVSIELSDGCYIRFAEREATVKVKTNKIKPIKMTFDEDKGDTASAPIVKATVKNKGAYTVDVDLKLNKELCDEAFATVYPWFVYENDTAALEAAVREAITNSKVPNAYQENFLFTTENMTYNEGNLRKNTAPSRTDCRGIEMSIQMDENGRQYSHDYYLVYGAKDKSGNWVLFWETLDMQRPDYLELEDDSEVSFTVVEKTKTEATIQIDIDGSPAKVCYFWMPWASEGMFSCAAGNTPFAVPQPYDGEPITLELTNLRKATTYRIWVITINEEGGLGELDVCYDVTTLGDTPGTCEITDCTFDPQIKANTLNAHLKVTNETVGVRVLAMSQNAFERWDSQSMKAGDEETMAKLYGYMNDDEGVYFELADDANRDNLAITIPLDTYWEESGDDRVAVYDDRYVILGAAYDSDGNIRTANLIRLAAAHNPDGAELDHSSAAGNHPLVDYWITIQADQLTGNFVDPDNSTTKLDVAWASEPQHRKITPRFTTKGLSDVILYVAKCDEYLEQQTNNVEDFFTANDYADFRRTYVVPSNGIAGSEITMDVEILVEQRTNYVIFATGITAGGDYITPVNVAKVCAGGASDKTFYNGNYIWYFYEPTFSISESQWNGTGECSLTFNTPMNGSQLANWELTRGTGAVSVIRYVFPDQEISQAQMIASIKATAAQIDPTVGALTLTAVNDTTGKASGYYNYIYDSNAIRVYSFSASEFTNRTWAFVVVTEEDGEMMYNIHSYIRCTNENPTLIHFGDTEEGYVEPGSDPTDPWGGTASYETEITNYNSSGAVVLDQHMDEDSTVALRFEFDKTVSIEDAVAKIKTLDWDSIVTNSGDYHTAKTIADPNGGTINYYFHTAYNKDSSWRVFAADRAPMFTNKLWIFVAIGPDGDGNKGMGQRHICFAGTYVSESEMEFQTIARDGSGNGSQGGNDPEPEPAPSFSAFVASNPTLTTIDLAFTVNYTGTKSFTSLKCKYGVAGTNTFSNSKDVTPAGAGNKSVTLNGLSGDTNYEYKIEAVINGETYTSAVQNFATSSIEPTFTDPSISSITASGATVSTNFGYTGSKTITSLTLCYWRTGVPSSEQTTAIYASTGVKSATISGLTAQTSYTVQFKAVIGGVTYRSETTDFETTPIAPVWGRMEASDITQTTATISGTFNYTGSTSDIGTVRFRYHVDGNPFTRVASTTNSYGTYSADLTELEPNTKYWFKLEVNIQGSWMESDETSFTTERASSGSDSSVAPSATIAITNQQSDSAYFTATLGENTAGACLISLYGAPSDFSDLAASAAELFVQKKGATSDSYAKDANSQLIYYIPLANGSAKYVNGPLKYVNHTLVLVVWSDTNTWNGGGSNPEYKVVSYMNYTDDHFTNF